MPAEWYAIDGAQMTKDLRQRRDGIVDYARKFYLHLADRVDVRATDRDDLASVEHFEDGALRLTLAPRESPTARRARPTTGGASCRRRRRRSASISRRQRPPGDERAARRAASHLRVLGGTGNDVLDDSKSGGADLQRLRGQEHVPARARARKVGRDRVEEPRARARTAPGSSRATTVTGRCRCSRSTGSRTRRSCSAAGFTRTRGASASTPGTTCREPTVLYSTGYNNVRRELLRRVAGSAIRALSARVDLARLGDREHELLRFRERDAEARRGASSQDRDERVHGYSPRCATARAQLRAARRRPRRRCVQTKGGDRPRGAGAGLRDRELRRSDGAHAVSSSTRGAGASG